MAKKIKKAAFCFVFELEKEVNLQGIFNENGGEYLICLIIRRWIK